MYSTSTAETKLFLALVLMLGLTMPIQAFQVWNKTWSPIPVQVFAGKTCGDNSKMLANRVTSATGLIHYGMLDREITPEDLAGNTDICIRVMGGLTGIKYDLSYAMMNAAICEMMVESDSADVGVIIRPYKNC